MLMIIGETYFGNGVLGVANNKQTNFLKSFKQRINVYIHYYYHCWARMYINDTCVYTMIWIVSSPMIEEWFLLLPLKLF